MYDKNLKNASNLVKIIVFIAAAITAVWMIMQKPKMSEEMLEMYRETDFKTYGGPAADTGWNVINTGDGFLISADTASYGAGGKDAYLIKTDEKGGLVWTRTFGDAGNDTVIGLSASNDGGYIAAGGTTSWGSGEADAYIIKTDKDGELVWDKTYGGANYDYAYSICKAKSGGYFFTGYTSSFSKNPDSDVYLVKIDDKGVKTWEKTFGGASWDTGYSVIALNDGGCMLAGYTESYGSGKTDMYIVRADAKGDCIWARTFGGEREDRASAIIKTRDNNFLIAGKSGSYTARGFGWDILLVKIDMNGNSLWSKVFPAADTDAGNSVAETADKGFIITGTKRCYGICDANVLVIKIDSEGNSEWTRIFAGRSDDTAQSVCLSNAGDYVACGTTLSYGHGRGDVLLLNVSKDGEKTW